MDETEGGRKWGSCGKEEVIEIQPWFKHVIVVIFKEETSRASFSQSDISCENSYNFMFTVESQI